MTDPSHTLTPKEGPKTREAHPAPEDSTSKPIPKGGPQAAPRHKRKRNVRLRRTAISSSPPGPVPPSLTTRRWKTPWTVHKSLLTEQPVPWSGTGQPVAEARSALRPLPQIKLDCPPLPAPGYRRRTGYPVLLRGELTLDFPLPASASGGQRSQPSLEPMTDDGPVRPTILPGLGGGGAPSPRSRDASRPALSKYREPNPASVFHRLPTNKRHTKQDPTIEYGTSALGGSASRGPNTPYLNPTITSLANRSTCDIPSSGGHTTFSTNSVTPTSTNACTISRIWSGVPIR